MTEHDQFLASNYNDVEEESLSDSIRRLNLALDEAYERWVDDVLDFENIEAYK